MTKSLTELLQEAGCDAEEANYRLFGEQEVYESFAKEYIEKLDLTYLEAVLATEDGKAVFELAHQWKGVTANLGLDILYKPLCLICDAFRNGKSGDVREPMEKLRNATRVLKELITP